MSRYDMVCEQGTTFRKDVAWQDENEQPVNLTGYSARMQVRATIKSAQVLAELSTINGKITLTPSQGKVSLQISAAETSALPARDCVYDLELTSPTGFVTRLLQGTFHITPEVTR